MMALPCEVNAASHWCVRVTVRVTSRVTLARYRVTSFAAPRLQVRRWTLNAGRLRTKTRTAANLDLVSSLTARTRKSRLSSTPQPARRASRIPQPASARSGIHAEEETTHQHSGPNHGRKTLHRTRVMLSAF
eukprot:2088475-Rhodomonas_salina.1